MSRNILDFRVIPYISETPGVVPVLADLLAGEIAVNSADKTVWVRDLSNNLVELLSGTYIGAPSWSITNISNEVTWDSGNAVYILRARDGAINLTKDPADTDSHLNWMLDHSGLYIHDPLAAHLYSEGASTRELGAANTYYELLGTATLAEKQASPATSAGWTTSCCGSAASTGVVAWSAANTSSDITWDSGNAVYTLKARTGAINLTKDPADTDSHLNWMLDHAGLYIHDPAAAHLYTTGTATRELGGARVFYELISGATLLEKQTAPSTSAGWAT